MADQTSLVIPAETAAKFGPLITLIQGSESMNMEERQYWINILPIMTPEQIKNLEDILSNEKSQLAAIDAKYAEGPGMSAASMGDTIRSKKKAREQTEKEAAESEQQKEADLMAQIQSL